MRRGRAGIVGLALLAWGCSATGDITGTITVAPGYAGQGVFAGLWQVPSDPSNPTKEAAGGQATFLGFSAVGITDSSGGHFKYSLHTLDRGLYIVGAFLWDNQGISPDFTKDLNFIDQDHPIAIDPSVKGEALVKRDLYLGMSDPSLGTITGTLHLSSRAAAVPTTLLVWTGDPYTTSPTLKIEQAVPSGQTDVSFQLFNTPLDPVFVMALSDINRNGQLDIYKDLVGFALGNPIAVDPTSHALSGVDLWVDRQSPALGSVQGTLALTAPLSTVNATVRAFSTDFEKDAGANVIGVANFSGAGTDTIPFTLPSLPVGPDGTTGTIFLDVLTETPGLVVPQVTAETAYVSPSPPDPASMSNPTQLLPVATTPGRATSVTLPVGAGRVTGTVQISNAPSDIAQGWVVATPSGTGPFGLQLAATKFTPGSSTVSYEVFGLFDGSFDMTFVPDLAKTGVLCAFSGEQNCNDLGSGIPGTPSSVTITHSSPQVSNFVYAFH